MAPSPLFSSKTSNMTTVLKESTKVEITEDSVKSFSWANIKLAVPIKKAEPKTLINNISGQVLAGEVIAIMGGSGAGKSTLLNTLAGRIANDSILSGSILLDGAERDPATWNRQCAYVEQDDVLYENLSVYETLVYSARLRLPRTLSREEKVARVNNVIAALGLEGCRDTKVGNELSRGISGGERKRLAIGIELVTNPKILFLDEPTSGLDAFNAFNAMETLKNLAKKEGKIILLTIHQPRTDILELFDKIILLSMGQLVWFGPTNDAIEFFGKQGHPLPPKTNPSDFFLDTITIDRRNDDLFKSSSARIEKFVTGYEVIKNLHIMEEVKSTASAVVHKVHWPSTYVGELLTLMDRDLLNSWRDAGTLGASIGGNVFVAIIICALFFQVTNDVAGIQNRLGAFFFILINVAFGTIGPSVNKFPDQKRIIRRERAAGSYRSSAAYLSKIFSSMPLLFIGVMIMAIPVYWAIGLQKAVGQFLVFLVIISVHALVAQNLGFVIGALAPTADAGQIMTPLILIVFMLFSGLLVNLDSITPALRWIQWLSFITYSYKALGQNEFDSGLVFSCPPGNGPQCVTNGSQIVTNLSLSNPTMWVSILVNVGFIFFYAFLGMAIFHRTSAPLQKLK